jgi:hypothetical protein
MMMTMCLILPTGELPGESAGGPVTPAGTSGTGHVIADDVVAPLAVGPGEGVLVPPDVGAPEAPELAVACGDADAEPPACGGFEPIVAPELQPASAVNERKTHAARARTVIR